MIKIQGMNYSVELVPPGMHSPFSGQSLPDDLRILVSSAIHPQKQEEVFIHEVTHMMLNQEPIVTALEHETFEGLISRLSTILYETLNENGLLVEGWMDKLVDARQGDYDAFASKNVVEQYDDSNPIRTVDKTAKDSIHGPIRKEGRSRRAG